MTPYILGVAIMAVLLWLVLKPSRPTLDSRMIDPSWDDDDDDDGELAKHFRSEPLYKVGDRVVFRYNWWSWRGENTVWVSFQPVQRDVFEEFRAEVWAEVTGTYASKLCLAFADGESSVPLSVCDGSSPITYYEAPNPEWIVKSQWASEWVGGNR